MLLCRSRAVERRFRARNSLAGVCCPAPVAKHRQVGCNPSERALTLFDRDKIESEPVTGIFLRQNGQISPRDYRNLRISTYRGRIGHQDDRIPVQRDLDCSWSTGFRRECAE